MLSPLPRDYNAASDLIERNLTRSRGDKIAIYDDAGAHTYAELGDRVDRFAAALGSLGIEMEQRIVLALLDTIDFPTAFLGAIKAGVVPIPVSTMLTPADYAYVLQDSRARALIVSQALWPHFKSLVQDHAFLRHVIVAGNDADGHLLLCDLLEKASPRLHPAPTTPDDVCFWLYSSGSTGAPKGTVHLHSHLIRTAELYALPVLGIEENDVVFSAAKLFFAYGLGNSLTFPMAVGASTVLMSERSTPASVSRVLRAHNPTIFCGVPTLYGALLASPDSPSRNELRVRRCVSAGESLPPEIARRWKERMGVEILDGIGSTEMLHIFLSNRPEDVRYGTTGTPVLGYEVRLLNEDGDPVKPGEIGEMQVSGPTSAVGYWNNREKSATTFIGPWTRSGDRFLRNDDGYFVYCGRSDDMLKVGGIFVSPIEVEAALISHSSVLEAAVIGHSDADDMVKPKAYVVLKPGYAASPELAESLKLHVKRQLAPYKFPRWIAFVADLPKTPTGKIQRFKLRAQDASGAI